MEVRSAMLCNAVQFNFVYACIRLIFHHWKAAEWKVQELGEREIRCGCVLCNAVRFNFVCACIRLIVFHHWKAMEWKVHELGERGIRCGGVQWYDLIHNHGERRVLCSMYVHKTHLPRLESYVVEVAGAG